MSLFLVLRENPFASALIAFIGFAFGGIGIELCNRWFPEKYVQLAASMSNSYSENGRSELMANFILENTGTVPIDNLEFTLSPKSSDCITQDCCTDYKRFQPSHVRAPSLRQVLAPPNEEIQNQSVKPHIFNQCRTFAGNIKKLQPAEGIGLQAYFPKAMLSIKPTWVITVYAEGGLNADIVLEPDFVPTREWVTQKLEGSVVQ